MKKEIKEEDEYARFKDKDGNFIMCPICESTEHTAGECERYGGEYD